MAKVKTRDRSKEALWRRTVRQPRQSRLGHCLGGVATTWPRHQMNEAFPTQGALGSPSAPQMEVSRAKEDAVSAFNTGGNPGMASFVSNCYLAEAAGMPVWHGSGNDMGIVDASYLHSCAAAANCTIPSDILGFLREDDMVIEPVELKDSYAIASDKPGLGVELDEAAAKKYSVKA